MDSAAWDKRYESAELVWGAGPNQFVAAELDTLAPGDALDLAAGEGRNAIWLAEKGFCVTAVDFSKVGLERGRAIAEKRGVEVTWLERDLVGYVPLAGGFDLVLLAYLHLPWSAVKEIIERAAAALRPGGTLFVIAHDRRNIEEGYGGPQSPEVLYGPDDVTALLGSLTVERAETVERRVQTDDGERVALDVLVRARR